jgi:hypothetical protein
MKMYTCDVSGNHFNTCISNFTTRGSVIIRHVHQSFYDTWISNFTQGTFMQHLNDDYEKQICEQQLKDYDETVF